MYPDLKHGPMEWTPQRVRKSFALPQQDPLPHSSLDQAAVTDHRGALQEVADEGAEHPVDQELREGEEVGLHDAHQRLKHSPRAAPGVHPIVSLVIIFIIVWVATEEGENIRLNLVSKQLCSHKTHRSFLSYI